MIMMDDDNNNNNNDDDDNNNDDDDDNNNDDDDNAVYNTHIFTLIILISSIEGCHRICRNCICFKSFYNDPSLCPRA